MEKQVYIVTQGGDLVESTLRHLEEKTPIFYGRARTGEPLLKCTPRLAELLKLNGIVLELYEIGNTQKNQYRIKFEFFGKKMVSTVQVSTPEEAMTIIRARLNFIQIEEFKTPSDIDGIIDNIFNNLKNQN